MKQLILHCGTTKTGTSAIQYGLSLNRKILLEKTQLTILYLRNYKKSIKVLMLLVMPNY